MVRLYGLTTVGDHNRGLAGIVVVRGRQLSSKFVAPGPKVRADHSYLMPAASNAPYALIVDDEPFIRMAACDMLDDAGFRCLEASEVGEALDLLRRHADEVELLFTDVHMHSDRDGFELARLAAASWPDINILVASGAVVPNDGDLPKGAVFISKPFSARLVHDRLQQLLPDDRKPEPLKKLAGG